MFRLHRHDLRFPPVEEATPEGLLAVGGDLQPDHLLASYRHGIFPWYNDDQPTIHWWSQDPRAVLFPEKLHVPRSLQKRLRQNRFTLTLDSSFRNVMEQCAGPRLQYPEGSQKKSRRDTHACTNSATPIRLKRGRMVISSVDCTAWRSMAPSMPSRFRSKGRAHGIDQQNPIGLTHRPVPEGSL